MENRNDSRNVSDFYRPIGNSGSTMNTNTECNGLIHTIQRGDTLYTLSKRYNVPLSLIMRANRDVDIYNLTIGTTLCIPNVRATAPEKYEAIPRSNMTVPEKIVAQPRSMTTPTSKKMMNQFVEKPKEEKMCPVCPKQQPCPEAAPCPTCPVQRPCPEQQPCPEPEPCPICPEVKPCPACQEAEVNVTMEKNYTFILPVQKTMPCNVCPKKESTCMMKEKACPYQEKVRSKRYEYGCEKPEKFSCDECNTKDDPRFQNDSLYRYGGYCDRKERMNYDTRMGAVPYTKLMAHIVADRETLEDILNMFGMTLEEILSYNKTREIHLCPGKAILVKKNR